MGNFVQGTQLRTLNFGTLVQKSWTLPASATTNTLFTTAGGACLVTMFVGRVTTLIGSTATTLTLGTTATGSTLDTDGLATGTTAVTSLEVGTLLTLQNSAGLSGALASGLIAGQAVWNSGTFVVNTGTITATTSANAGAGVINWYLAYVPLDDGASIVAA